jgi:filamentous hemagglutinin family protein
MLKALFTWLGLSLCTLGYLVATNNPAFAQVTSDGTVNTEVNGDGDTAEITGGETRGDNLFHSFEDFSVETGNEAFFNNADTISNIFSRVTGGNVSDIDGAIRANGSASLFLINPAGIVFGENASLNIGGSFYGSSASSILFEDGEFSAADLENPPLLTINAPIGLGFRDQPGDIVNRSTAVDNAGLQVSPGETISLIGGDINFDGGLIFAPGGNVELGGLSTAGEIRINSNGSLSFPDGLARSDVSLQNSSGVLVTSGGGGNIIVNARNFELQDSAFSAGIGSGLGSPDAQAGDISINATDNVSVDGQGSSNLTAINNSLSDNAIGNAGEINISARNISLNNGGQILSFVAGQGNSSNITFNARENISVNGTNDSVNSGVNNFIEVSGEGNSGQTNITAQNLTLSNGGDISSLVAGIGDSGDININVQDSLTVDGEGILTDRILPSIISSRVASDGQGNSGDIKINTSKLSLTNGGQIDVGIFGRGDAGNIDINSTESITLDGISPQRRSFSEINSSVLPTAEGNAGDIEITTNRLSLTNGGNINSNTSGIGNGGNIDINSTESITLDGISPIGIGFSGINSLVGSTAEGDAGNIQISTRNFTLSNNASVDASTFGRGNGGEIKITATNLSLINGGGIIASILGSTDGDNTAQGNAGDITINVADTLSINGTGTLEFQGQVRKTSAGISASNLGNSIGNAGNIDITASKLSLANGSQITSFSRGRGDAGNITINAQDSILLDTGNESEVATGISTDLEEGGEGNSGNIFIQANSLNLNGDSIISAATSFGIGGNIQLQVADGVVLDNNSSISAKAINNANGGNLTIDSNFIVAFPNGNSDILASAEQGEGGNITIDAESLFGIEERPLNDSTNDINASSNFDLDGTVNINTSKIDPLQGTIELPSNVVEATQTAEQTCSADPDGKANNGLAIAGRGGVTPPPDAPLNSENISNENPAQASIPEPIETAQGKIQPARGIKFTKDGRIILTAYRTNNAGERIPEIKPNCSNALTILD